MAENEMARRSPTTYRPARRRPAHLRTKTGCLTCRKRKKKCDESLPQCLNCTKQRRTCLWQAPEQSPVSPDEQLNGSTGRDSSEVISKETIEPTQEPFRWSSNSVLSLCHLPLGYSPAITPDSGPLFDFLRSTFLPQLIHPATNENVTDGLNRETTILALSHPFCMHALLACSGAEMPTGIENFRQLARFHYTQAVAGLRGALNDNNLERQWVVSMLTIMMLCIYERAKPNGSLGVEIHLAGAARLIAFYSGKSPKKCYDDQTPSSESRMHRLVRESFIFHVATSLPFHHQSDSHHVEIENALFLAEQAISRYFRPGLISHFDSPVLAFPPQLFRSIYTVYRLHQYSRKQHVGIEKRRDLDQDLQQWDELIKEQSYVLIKTNSSPGGNCDTIDPSKMEDQLKNCSMGPKLYILGCRLLLRSRAEQSQLTPAMDELLSEGIGLVRQLQPDQDYYADYYCWPLLAIGMHLKSPIDRQLLLRQVWAFWTATNNRTMRRLADMLELFWR